MGYYEDDFEEPYYGYEERIEPVNLVAEEITESDITETLLAAGLVFEKRPNLICNMEKLVFVNGDPNEVYSQSEIRFTETIDKIYVYSDFFVNLNEGSMACRVIAARIASEGQDALEACVFFEKIVNKAFDGFNIFLFVTDEGLFLGCKVFDNTGKNDCTLSKPILSQREFEQIQDELFFLWDTNNFRDFYNYFKSVITCGNTKKDDYDMLIVKKRGIQFDYLEAIDELGRDIGVDMILEKERYRQVFEDDTEVPFDDLLNEVNERLSFIKSNRVNTYEMLFEADEMMRQAEEAEAENIRIAEKNVFGNSLPESSLDYEAEALLDNPEEMIKLFKKRRGI